MNNEDCTDFETRFCCSVKEVSDSHSTTMTPETSTQPDRRTDETINGMVYGATVVEHHFSTSAPMEYIRSTTDNQETSTFFEIESNSSETIIILSTTNECRILSDFKNLTLNFENLPSSASELRKFKNL